MTPQNQGRSSSYSSEEVIKRTILEVPVKEYV